MLLSLACQIIPTPPPLESSPRSTPTSQVFQPLNLSATPQERYQSTPSLQPGLGLPRAPGDLQPIPYDPAEPFSAVTFTDWDPAGSADLQVNLPVDLAKLANPQVLTGLTSRQRSFLSKNGFVVVRSQEGQFNEIRQRVSSQYGQPYLLTTDAVYHSLSLTLDETISAMEREELRPRLTDITRATLEEIDRYYPLVKGTALEADTWIAAAYLGVALRLLDPAAKLPENIVTMVNQQVDQILRAKGVEESLLIPDFMDDYSTYHPVGHYAGESDLEAYYHAMTWYTNVPFGLSDLSPDKVPSRVPLIITLALRRARIKGELVSNEWSKVHEIITFLHGPNRSFGPFETAELMDRVYGPGVTIIGLSDQNLWQLFQTQSLGMPLLQFNSAFFNLESGYPGPLDWRFFGPRFTIDRYILEDMVSVRVGSGEQPRALPSGLDIMAALGSNSAMKALKDIGATDYPNFTTQLTRLQNAAIAQREEQWLSTASNIWMYAFLPQLLDKSVKYPPVMRTDAWSYKELNSALGSWVDRLHTSSLFVDPIGMPGSKGQPASQPPPGYVEPNPMVFYRLAFLTNSFVEGLRERDMLGIFSSNPENLSNLVLALQDLGDRLQRLGDIASKELAGDLLGENDYLLIQAPLGLAEQRYANRQEVFKNTGIDTVGFPPMEAIAPITSAGDHIFQVGLGPLDRIFLIVPLEGELYVAQGGVYSYYEFSWMQEDQLNDTSWRRLLRNDIPEPPSWLVNYLLPDGNPVDYLVFRIGDIYRITREGSLLSLRAQPSRASDVVTKLLVGDQVKIVDGPVDAEGFTWWKIEQDLDDGAALEGWAVENQEWYQRVWSQESIH